MNHKADRLRLRHLALGTASVHVEILAFSKQLYFIYLSRIYSSLETIQIQLIWESQLIYKINYEI
jgi:hypothetical protein